MLLFFVAGAAYVAGHFLLQLVAFVQVFTGREGEWEVTARDTKGTTPQATPQPARAAAGAAAETADAACSRGCAAAALSEPLLRRA